MNRIIHLKGILHMFRIIPAVGATLKLVSLKYLATGPWMLFLIGAVFAVVDGGITALIVAHPFTVAVCVYYTLSSAVISMSNPWDGMYNWFYRFSHGMVAVVRTEIDKREKTSSVVTTSTSLAGDRTSSTEETRTGAPKVVQL